MIFLSPWSPLGLLAVIDAYNTTYKETKQGETPGASSDLNRLDKDPIYVGGLPRSRVVRYDTTLQNCRVPNYSFSFHNKIPQTRQLKQQKWLTNV